MNYPERETQGEAVLIADELEDVACSLVRIWEQIQPNGKCTQQLINLTDSERALAQRCERSP